MTQITIQRKHVLLSFYFERVTLGVYFDLDVLLPSALKYIG